MLVPFQKETLSQERFLRQEVRFNLLYRISEGDCATALQARGGGAVALQSPGRALMLWLDAGMGKEYAAAVAGELAEKLRGAKLPGVMAEPEIAAAFVEAYKAVCGAMPELSTRLMAYECPRVRPPSGVPGRAVKACERHVEAVARFRGGFLSEIYGTSASREELLRDAYGLVQGGGLFVWETDGQAVGMAALGHRSKRYVRVNNVYTLPEHRKKGCASALVAYISQSALDDGVTPMLYADYDYPASNAVYRSIGYLEAGRIDEYSFIYNELKS